MDFILRIFFSGMITFVPGNDGRELTVLLMNAHGSELSDGSTLAHHRPLLLARAQSCSGNCERRDPEIATFLYAGKSEAQAIDSLENALGGGGAWQLRDVDLSVRKIATTDGCLHPPLLLNSGVRGVDENGALPIPTNAEELQDFSWVADLRQVAPSIGSINPAVLATRPPASLIAARLKLRVGKVSTYSLVRVFRKVKPIYFRPLGGDTGMPYSQAVANWVVAEIRVPGSAVELVSQNYDDGTTRTMRLTPRNGHVEVALLNVPAFEAPPPGEIPPLPEPGKHFEEYFELAATPPATRPVPHVNSDAEQPEVDWQTVADNRASSELLSLLRIDPGRGFYDRTLCPITQYEP